MKKYRFFRLSLGWQIVIGLVLGIVCGAFTYHNQGAITIMSNLGTIFLRLIQMIVLPIVVSCLTVGIANIGDLHKLGRIGGKTIIYFEVLTTIAIVLGLVVGNLAHPGTFINIHDLQGSDISKYMTTAKSASHTGIWDTILAIIPTNIFKSLADGEMMPVIFFSVFFGLGIAAIGERGKVLVDVLNGVSEVMFKVTNWVMKFAPIGVFGLIGMTVAQMGLSALLPLGYFILIAYVTMVIFCVVVLLASVSTIGVPVAGLTFIAGIDRFVDMGRTAVNVVGNTVATLVIGESEKSLDQDKYHHYLDNYKKEDLKEA